MWELPGPGIEPTSPALAGEFLTTVPPGKSRLLFFFFKLKHFILLLLYGRHYGFYIINVPIVASQLENFVHKSTVDFSK